jgi:hypothetical protein
MLEAKSAITLALACCLSPAVSPATSQSSPINIRLEVSLRRFTAHNTCNIEFIFRLGLRETTSASLTRDSLQNLPQSFESLRDAAREIYRKQRHMA